MLQIQVRVKSKYNLINYIYILLIYRTLNWKKSVDETERFLDGKNLPCVLVENKSDLLDQNKVNNLTELKKFAKENEFVGCFRTSAKTGYNIEEAMSFLIETVLDRMSKMSSKEFAPDRRTVTLDPEKHENNDNYRQQQKSGCC